MAYPGSSTFPGSTYPQAAPTTPPPDPAAVFDDFNRADTTTGLGTSSSGHVWSPTTYVSGRILSNQYRGISDGNDRCVTLDVGASDFTVKATIQTDGTSDTSLVGRYVNDSNYWMAYCGSGASGKWGLWYRNGGTYSNVSTSTVVPVAGDVVELVFSGTSVKLRVNGVEFASVTSTVHQSATRAGFRSGNGLPATWDDFSASTPTTSATGFVSVSAPAAQVAVAGAVTEVASGVVAVSAPSATLGVTGDVVTLGAVSASAPLPDVSVHGEVADITGGAVEAVAPSPTVVVDGVIVPPVTGTLGATAPAPAAHVTDAPPLPPAEFTATSALDVAPLIDTTGMLGGAEFTASSVLDVGTLYDIEASAGVEFTAESWLRVIDELEVAIDPLTRRPQYKLVAVDMFGTPIAELDSAVMGSATRSLNGRGGFSFRLGKTDPKLPNVPQFAEVQLWRGSHLVPGGWFVITDPAIGQGDDSFDLQCAGLAWHFEGRLVGKERPELLKNGGFEDGPRFWDFSYSPGSNAETPPKWEITDEACEGGKALRVFADDKVVEFKRTVETQGVFVANSSTFLSGGEQFIRDAIEDIPQKQSIVIEGHTADADGGTGYALSVARAEAAKAVAHAARPDLTITAVGKGETEQVASNATEAGRRKNRRVVIRANFTATKVGHRQFVGQSFTYTNDTDEPLEFDIQAQGRIDTWGGPSKDGWMLYADVRTIAAKPKILNNGSTNVDEFTVRNRWMPLHTTVEVPANTTARVNVRGYPTAGASSFDQFSAMPNLKLTFNQKDPQQVICGLVEHAQDPAFGKSDLNIQGFGNWSGFKIDRSYPWKEHIRVSDAIDEVVRSLNGPDANMLVTARRRWLVVSPKQGHETGIVLAAGNRIGDARILSYESGVDGDEVATTAIVQSSWSGGGMSEVIARKPRSDGKVFERLYQAEQDAPTSTLTEQAGTAVEYGRAGLVTKVTIHPDDTTFLMSRVTIGDVVAVDVHDSQVQVRADHRIIQIDLDPNTDQYTYTLAPKE